MKTFEMTIGGSVFTTVASDIHEALYQAAEIAADMNKSEGVPFPIKAVVAGQPVARLSPSVVTLGKICRWEAPTDDLNVWDSECKRSWTMEDGTPKTNDMKFCPFCGGALVETRDGAIVEYH